MEENKELSPMEEPMHETDMSCQQDYQQPNQQFYQQGYQQLNQQSYQQGYQQPYQQPYQGYQQPYQGYQQPYQMNDVPYGLPYDVPVDEGKKKKGSFWGGFAVATAVCLCAVICGVFVSRAFGFVSNIFGKDVLNSGSGLSYQSSVLTDDEAEELLGKVEKLIYYIQLFYIDDVDVDDLLDGAYHGIVDALGDKYAAYYNEEELLDFTSSSNGEYVGIGVTVMESETGMGAEVISVNQSGGAYEMGIEPGDILVAADGVDLAGMTLNEMVTYIRGEEGTYVDITFNREGKEEVVSIERRALIETAVFYTMMEDGIGYISLTEFTAVATKQFEDAMADLDQQGMRALILDLRDDGGGLVDVCVDIADTMIDTGLVTYMEDKYGQREEYKATKKGCYDIPIVILVNENTASASELLTTCLKDYGKATVVGTLTYGKGIVQSTYNLMDGTAVKMTTNMYYSPNGTNVQDVGVTPDYVVEFPEDVSLARIKNSGIPDVAQDPQLQKALELLK